MTPPFWRLRDGSQPEDWSPDPGDAPCDATGHHGHSRNGCPALHTDAQEGPTDERP